MNTERSPFVQPADFDAKVWRYMNFTKFVSLLDSNSLYFTRTDRFKDPFEGAWPTGIVDALRNALSDPSIEHGEIIEQLRRCAAATRYGYLK